MELKIKPFKFNFANDVIKSILKFECNNDNGEELLTPEVTIERVRYRKRETLKFDSSRRGVYAFEEAPKEAFSEIPTHFLVESRCFNVSCRYENEVSSSPNVHKCPLCEYRAPRRDVLKLHLKSEHKTYKPFWCPLCSYRSLERKMLTRHFLSVHERFKPHKCPECDYSASLNSNLKKHVENVHRKNKPHKCSQCPYSTSEKGKLRRHVQSVHSDIRPFVCKLCLYSANRDSALRNHVLTAHSNERSAYVCGECSFSTTDSLHLRRHVTTSHDTLQTLKCRKCQLYFGSRYSLTRHDRQSHSRLCPKLFECGDCNKIYRDKRSMKIHVLSVHLKEKPFKCDLCTYRTVDTRYLRKHVASNHRT